MAAFPSGHLSFSSPSPFCEPRGGGRREGKCLSRAPSDTRGRRRSFCQKIDAQAAFRSIRDHSRTTASPPSPPPPSSFSNTQTRGRQRPSRAQRERERWSITHSSLSLARFETDELRASPPLHFHHFGYGRRERSSCTTGSLGQRRKEDLHLPVLTWTARRPNACAPPTSETMSSPIITAYGFAFHHLLNDVLHPLWLPSGQAPPGSRPPRASR